MPLREIPERGADPLLRLRRCDAEDDGWVTPSGAARRKEWGGPRQQGPPRVLATPSSFAWNAELRAGMEPGLRHACRMTEGPALNRLQSKNAASGPDEQPSSRGGVASVCEGSRATVGPSRFALHSEKNCGAFVRPPVDRWFANPLNSETGLVKGGTCTFRSRTMTAPATSWPAASWAYARGGAPPNERSRRPSQRSD
jgi:hypothetical protein